MFTEISSSRSWLELGEITQQQHVRQYLSERRLFLHIVAVALHRRVRANKDCERCGKD